MHGQYKSIVNCPRCHRFSVTFDPFSTIPLQLPQETGATIIFYYVPYDLSKNVVKYSITAEKTETIKSFRERLGTLLGINKDSLMLTMISANTFDRYICRERTVKLISKMEKKRNSFLYAMEINPKYFKGPENLGIEAREGVEKEKEKMKIESEQKESAQRQNKDIEMEENKKVSKMEEEKYGNPSYSSHINEGFSQNRMYVKKKREQDIVNDHDDYNNGLEDNMLRVCISMYQHGRRMGWTTSIKDRKTFNRLIYIKRSHTLKDLHFEIFQYFKPLFIKTYEREKLNGGICNKPEAQIGMDNGGLEDIWSKSDEEIFNKLFPDLNEENWEEKLQIPNNYPYVLKFINIASKSYMNKEKCYYCNKDTCDNCPVPFTSKLNVSDMLNKINSKEIIKNDYYYKEHQVYNEGKKEFELEILFNEDKSKTLLDIEHLERFELHMEVENEQKGKGLSIYTCFDSFNNWETLDKNNLWYCNGCKESVQASKKMEIFKCPPILILHLKRFKTKETPGFMSGGGRLNTLVDFPLTGLDLKKYVKCTGIPTIYNLYAVSNHYGSMGFGHYTAFAFNNHKKRWYKFDDSSATPIEPSEVCSTAAYILFYKRADLEGEVDYEKIKQAPPPDYKPPLIETKPVEKKEVKKNESFLPNFNKEQKMQPQMNMSQNQDQGVPMQDINHNHGHVEEMHDIIQRTAQRVMEEYTIIPNIANPMLIEQIKKAMRDNNNMGPSI